MMGTSLVRALASGHSQGVPLLAVLSISPAMTLVAMNLSSRRFLAKNPHPGEYLHVVPPRIVGTNEPPLEP